jgi:hypothetical protein
VYTDLAMKFTLWPSPEEGVEPMTSKDRIMTGLIVAIMVALAAVWMCWPQ